MVFKRSLAMVLAVSAVVCSVFCAPMSAEAKKDKKEKKEEVVQETRLKLTYDDRYTFDSPIKNIEQVKIESRIPGTKVPDVAVLISEDKNKIAATGCGVARVTLKGGEVYRVAVKSAPISLILMIGQSNMEGGCSVKEEVDLYKSQQILSPEGTVYSTYAPAYGFNCKYVGYYNEKLTLKLNNANKFIPETLTANGSKHSYRHTNNLTDASVTGGKNGMDGAFGYNWCKLTKEKVWLINAANSGSSILEWQPEANSYYDRAMGLYHRAMGVLDAEIEAGHYELSQKGYLWMQGETDSEMKGTDYYMQYVRLHNALKAGMYGSEYKNLKKPISFAGLCMIRNVEKSILPYTREVYDDFKSNGPREAYKEIARSENKMLKDVIMATDVEEKWASDEDVAEYFEDAYGSVKKYNKYNPMVKEVEALPQSVADVHDNIHYKQLGYNEIGRTAALEICDYLGY
ncbi:MAG: sialate O-acetylesterase [Lachnospiraceae bacterium]|nr:sialate O-acetylesterase [Lachnospiraceae bacterium]